MVRMQVAMIVSQIAQALLSKMQHFKCNWWQQNEIIIFNEGENNNQLYTQVEDYLVSKYNINIKSFELQSKRGDMGLSIHEPITFQTVEQGATIHITISNETSTSSTAKSRRSIRFTSKLPISAIQTYIKNIAVQKIVSNVLTIYRTRRITSDKHESVEWEQIDMKTNKTYHNTIYSDEVQHQLFDDVKHFIEHEDEWARRGTDYKRGYLLHGLPGTGKTSVAKILANMYNLPVFILDVANLTDDELMTLVTDINYFTRNQRYILLMEDLDRTSIFDDEFDRYGHRRNSKGPSLQTFLNILDGMLNPFGRILIITGNDVSKFRNCAVAFRPGRIDREIEFGHCTSEQIRRLVELFYNVVIGDVAFNKITPAELIKLMQSHTTVETLMEKLVVHESKASLDDVDAGLLGTSGLKSRKPSLRQLTGGRRRIETLKQNVKRTLANITSGVKAMSQLDELKQKLEMETVKQNIKIEAEKKRLAKSAATTAQRRKKQK